MRHRLVPAAFAATLWLGCEGGLFTIHVEEEAETTISAGSLLENLLGDLGFEGFLDMDVTASEELQNQGVQPGDVQDVRLERFDLATVGQGDLAFIESLDVYVSAPDLDEVLVASVADIPDGATSVALTVEDLDLTAYVVSRSMTFTTDITGHRPEQETTVKATISLAVGVTGQGACDQIQADTEGR